MAEGIFKQELTKSIKKDCFISSAGLNALIGHKADPKACQVMAQKGIDISSHRACQLNNEMVRKADLILVMERLHKNAIEENEPSTRGKVFRLGEWEKFDIADPYQKDLSVFEETLILIEHGVSHWIKKLS